MRRYLTAGLVLLLLLSSCAIESEEARIAALPYCDHSNTGRLILMAQSVPSAQVIPCINGELPDGWRLEHADVETDRSRLRFDNEAGREVVVYLLPSCSPAGEAGTSLLAGVASFQSIDESGRVDEYIFDGGCIRLEASLDEASSRMAAAIGLLTKDQLRTGSGWELPD